MVDRKLLEAEQGDPVCTLAQVRASTVILRLDAEHNESVTRFLIDSGLAVRSEHSIRLLRGIPLSHATLSDAHLSNADLSGADLRRAVLKGAILAHADLSDALGLTNEELEQQVRSLKGATMLNGQKYEEWLKDKKAQGKDEKNE